MSKTDLFWNREVNHTLDRSSIFRLARAAELFAAFELTRLGADVSLVCEGKPYDLLADIKHRLWRIQVKSSTGDRAPNTYQFSLKHGSSKGNGKAKFYTSDQVDAFAMVALDIKRAMFMSFADIDGLHSFRLKAFQLLDTKDIAAESFIKTFGTISI